MRSSRSSSRPYKEGDQPGGQEIIRVRFPSQPHAHCIGGPTRFIGSKLHLGTRQLFAGAKPLGLFLHKKPFTKLIKLIQPKFPSIKLPLES